MIIWVCSQVRMEDRTPVRLRILWWTQWWITILKIYQHGWLPSSMVSLLQVLGQRGTIFCPEMLRKLIEVWIKNWCKYINKCSDEHKQLLRAKRYAMEVSLKFAMRKQAEKKQKMQGTVFIIIHNECYRWSLETWDWNICFELSHNKVLHLASGWRTLEWCIWSRVCTHRSDKQFLMSISVLPLNFTRQSVSL